MVSSVGATLCALTRRGGGDGNLPVNWGEVISFSKSSLKSGVAVVAGGGVLSGAGA